LQTDKAQAPETIRDANSLDYLVAPVSKAGVDNMIRELEESCVT
jgi:hypothetical protein